MRKLRALLIRLRDLLSFHRGEDDFAAELESHVAMHTEDGIRAGLSPEEARRQAMIRLGGAEQTRQAYRERRGLPWLETFWQDIRFAARMLAKSPGFTAVAVLTLAFGIGVNSTVFTVAEAALLRSWPAHEPERLAQIVSTIPRGQDYSFSYPDYQDLAGQSRALQGVLAYAGHGAVLRMGTESLTVLDEVVSPNFFPVLGLNPQLGRTFSADSGANGDLSVVVGDSLWRRVFHADPSLVGKQIQLNGRSYTVLGIAPPGFRGLNRAASADLWLPVATEYTNADLADRKFRDFEVLGRLQPGVTAAQAKADLDTIGRRLAQAYPVTDKARNVTLISEQERRREAMAPTLFLMTVVGLVLMICCANVAGLVLARADARRREIAVRLALGAKRLRLVRQLLTESLLLAAMGAALGLLLAAGLIRLQPALLPPMEVTVGLDLRLDAVVLSYTAVLSVLTVLIFGLAPSIQASKASCVSALKGEERSVGRSVRRLTLRNALVLGQIALSVLLLTASGLVVRSLLFSRSIPLGFDRQKHLIFFDLNPDMSGYNAQRSAAFFEQVEARALAMPGVRHASLVRRVLLSDTGGGNVKQVSMPGVELPQGQPNISIKFNEVDDNYFQTMGTRLMEGRAFTSADNRSAASIVIVSQTMASRFWPGQEALGRQIVVEGKASQIVGIVEDAKINKVHEDAEPYMYFPFAQRQQSEGTLIVEAEGRTGPLVDRIRSEIRSVDKNVPVDVRTLSYLMRQAYWEDQMAAGFVATLGLLAIFIGMLGLYGVVSFVVNRRKQEIAIRMALGAERRDIVRLVLGQGLALAAVGTGVGLVAAFGATRLMADMLYGVRPTDPIAFAGSAALVILVALAASWIPARRAASIDPMRALRTE
jgi:macrolide transport system ATP-binding/permease protein